MNAELIKSLFNLGWKFFPSLEQSITNMTPEQLELLKGLYATFHGLQSVDDVDDHVNVIRMCKHPDVMPIQASMPRWPVPAGETFEVTWTITSDHPSFSHADFVQCADNAWSRWAAVANIVPTYVPNSKTANVLMSVKYIDGHFGVLGESQLPMGQGTTQLSQWFDTGDKFLAFDGPKSGSIDIVRVMTHELGHILGMNHIGTGNLLAPVYSDNIWLPQAGDIAEMKARYPGVAAPTKPPPPPAGHDYTIRIDAEGVLSVEGYRLTKLP